jgi:1A family penicillin-binding protein
LGSRVIKNRRGTKRKHPIVGVLYVLGAISLLLIICGIGFLALCQSWLEDLPDYSDPSNYQLSQKTRVYASDHKTLLAEFYTEDRDPVTKDQISNLVWEGTVDTEDERFYEHHGVDLQGILRALVVNLSGTGSEGASTITQQLVRNTVLADEASENTLKRKVREAYIAVKLEQMYSKDEILLMYLNTINYGSGTYGIQAAAQKYYSTDADKLTVAQAATLIGIPQSPSENNPIDHPSTCKKRRNLVLQRMLTHGTITQEQYDKAVKQKLNLKVQDKKSENGIYKYPYFTSYVRDTLLDMYSSDAVYKGGLTVYTTLDKKVQNAANQACRKKEASIASDLEVAMSVVDPSNGYVKAIVGGRDYSKNQYNLATQAQRQPGSSFKTFTLLACIENHMNPNTTYVNCGSTATLGNWTVSNIDNNDYGTRTVTSAFAVSSNTGFARLCKWVGPSKVVDMAKRCGITSKLYAVPSITLGSYGVTPLEMSVAYATIANGGTHHDARCISEVKDSNGNTIYTADTTGTKVIDTDVAMAAEKSMEKVLETGGTGTAAKLSNGQAAAGKTGTSENYRDSWFCGFTPQYSVAIWMGARQERSMDSSAEVSDVFSDFMTTALEGQETEEFPEADTPSYKEVNDSSLGIYSRSSSSSSSSGSSSGSVSSTTTSTGSTASSSSASSSTGAQNSSGSDSTTKSTTATAAAYRTEGSDLTEGDDVLNENELFASSTRGALRYYPKSSDKSVA